MALTVVHNFHSAAGEAADPDVVDGASWNENHVISGVIPAASYVGEFGTGSNITKIKGIGLDLYNDGTGIYVGTLDDSYPYSHWMVLATAWDGSGVPLGVSYTVTEPDSVTTLTITIRTLAGVAVSPESGYLNIVAFLNET